ncbi:MAG TPA: transferrin receptor-like dimerization domain-containing protein [Jatrophihabitans sp.]|nr:transferrin receptor-like dimerization domain-containing protein [Jatrophihabitans sp.]
MHYAGYANEVGGYVNQPSAEQNHVFGGEVVDLTRDKQQAAAWGAAASGVEARIRAALTGGAPPATLDRLTVRLERVERELLVAAGLPGRPWFRHQIYAPGVNSGDGTQLLPGINDALFLRNNTDEARHVGLTPQG